MTYWLAFLSIFIASLSSNKKIGNLFIFLILLFLSGFIASGVSQDYYNYLNGYYLTVPVFFPEPLSKLIFQLAAQFGLSISVSFFIFSLISMCIKKKALEKLEISFAIFFLVYFSKLFLLHDLTQVRAGVAVAFSLFAFIHYINRNASRCLFYIFIGFLFHYSAILFVAVFLVGRKKPNTLLWLLMVGLAILLTFFNLKQLLLTTFILFHAPANYLSYLDSGTDFQVNPFSLLSIINLIVFLLFSLNINLLKDEVLSMAYKLYGISIISFYVFINFPVLSFRISEFFLIYQVILLSRAYYYIELSQRGIYIFILGGFSALQLYITYNVSQVILPYKFIWG